MSLPSVSDYSLLEKIGSGSYATVYKAFKKDGCREVVAIKCVEKSSLSKSAIDNLVTEINLLKILKHEHIVEMKDFFWDEGHIYIVMEYCDGGDLSSFIRKKHKLPEPICRRFLQQLALALKYLRNHNVSHMDLKPQNLLLMKKPQLTLKVGGETDLKRKEILRSHVNDYIKRAEILKTSCTDDSNEREKCLPGNGEGSSSTVQRVPSLNGIFSFVYHELRTLSKSTTSMADALEIGEVAEQYLAEGNYALALEKFQACLGLLVPLLGKEPPGRRRDLLYKQVQLWMKEAESTKGLLATKYMEDSAQRGPDSIEQCTVQ